MIAVPDWLKNSPFVCHNPSKTLFTPQRRIVRQSNEAWLLDANDAYYRFSECGPVQEIRGLYLLITDEGTCLSLWRERVPHHGDCLVLSSGTRQVGIRLEQPPDEVKSAAQSLAAFFNGAVVRDPETALAALGGGNA